MSFTKQPKRRQIKKLMSKSICTFNGRKGIVSPMYFESPLARDYCYFLEFDTSVLKYMYRIFSYNQLKYIEKRLRL